MGARHSGAAARARIHPILLHVQSRGHGGAARTTSRPRVAVRGAIAGSLVLHVPRSLLAVSRAGCSNEMGVEKE
jgi:hypothetical protein